MRGGYKHSLVGNVDLLELGLGLDGFYALLLHVAVCRLPHVVVFYQVFQCFPRQLHIINK